MEASGGAGVSPAIFLFFTLRKNAGETPAPRKTCTLVNKIEETRFIALEKDQSAANAESHGFRAASRAELTQDGCHVKLDGVL